MARSSFRPYVMRSSQADQFGPRPQDPPPWIPAAAAHTTSGVSDKAELHMVRAVDTGIINVRSTPRTPRCKLTDMEPGFTCRAGIGIQTQS